MTIDEFSDLKMQGMQKLLAWVKSPGGPVVQ
jgi:hypothetical protein